MFNDNVLDKSQRNQRSIQEEYPNQTSGLGQKHDKDGCLENVMVRLF